MDYLTDFGPRSTFAARYEKENLNPSPYTYRRSSPIPVGPTLAESKYMSDQMRHSQYVSRYVLPPPLPPPPEIVHAVPRLSQHQDFFIHELTAEVNELKSK